MGASVKALTGGPATRPTIAVFASDKGPGDAERASIMSQAGTYFARKGARIVCLAEGRSVAIPLITSARAAGGEIVVIGDDSFTLPRALSGIPLELFTEADQRFTRIGSLADAFVGLPGSLASISNLYLSWLKAGGPTAGKPIVFYNRNNAFEVLRGYIADVVAHSVPHHERLVQFSDSIEDLWNRVNRLVA
jgi:predicted Rossmann-fold nucleotide-binding protein